MNKHLIQEGDEVSVYDVNGHNIVTGKVHYIPCATGDTWIITTEGTVMDHVYYIQSYSYIVKGIYK